MITINKPQQYKKDLRTPKFKDCRKTLDNLTEFSKTLDDYSLNILPQIEMLYGKEAK